MCAQLFLDPKNVNAESVSKIQLNGACRRYASNYVDVVWMRIWCRKIQHKIHVRKWRVTYFFCNSIFCVVFPDTDFSLKSRNPRPVPHQNSLCEHTLMLAEFFCRIRAHNGFSAENFCSKATGESAQTKPHQIVQILLPKKTVFLAMLT